MRTTPSIVLLLILAAVPARSQYVPPSPAAPVAGAIDDYFRAADPAFKAWDFGLNERLRSENKSGAGTTHAGSNYDFASAPPTTNTNDYWLSRFMPRVGYTADGFSITIEGRSSYSLATTGSTRRRRARA